MTMRPIVVVADDYGISDATSAVIADLLAAGAINATGCLVETEAWARTAPALRKLWNGTSGIATGLHLNLTDPFPLAPPGVRDGAPQWIKKAALATDLASTRKIHATFRRQWDLFVAHFGAPPDFIDGHQHVHLFAPARRALFRLIVETRFGGWVRQCRTSSNRLAPERLALDPLSLALSGTARRLKVSVNAGFGGLRGFKPGEAFEALWARDLDAMTKGGVLMVHPGGSGSPPGTDGIDACRGEEADALRRGVLREMMARLDLNLAANPRDPWS